MKETIILICVTIAALSACYYLENLIRIYRHKLITKIREKFIVREPVNLRRHIDTLSYLEVKTELKRLASAPEQLSRKILTFLSPRP